MSSGSQDYRVNLEPLSEEDGGGWLAYAPDLAGCMSDGATRAEALHNVELAIAEWLDTAKELGRPIPEPSRRLAHA